MKAIKNYFNALNERERLLVIGALACLLIYLYYFVFFAHLNNSLMQKNQQLTEKIETLKWMQQVWSQSHESKVKKSVDNSQLLTLIADELKANKQQNFPYQLQQTSSGDIQLSFEKVPFGLFMLWLEKIGKNYSINIKQLEVDPTKVAGLTRVLLIITG